MAFTTILGTFVSQVMQQGDCNTPSTFQRLMTAIFQDYIGKFVHIYLDDIFVFSNTLREHEQELVFKRLEVAQLYLSCNKVDLYSKSMDCLGHLINTKEYTLIGIRCSV